MELSTQRGSEDSFATGLYEAGLMASEKLICHIISILSCVVRHTRQVQEVVCRAGSIQGKGMAPSQPNPSLLSDPRMEIWHNFIQTDVTLVPLLLHSITYL